MRRNRLALVLLLGTLQFSVIAQHELKTNMLGLIAGSYGLQYEYYKEEIGFLFGFHSFAGGGDLLFEEDYNSFVITPEFRYYFNPDQDASGYFFSGYLRMRIANSQDYIVLSVYDENTGEYLGEDTYDLKNFGVGVGFTLGYKWVTRAGLVFESFIGAGRYFVNNSSIEPEPPLDYEYYDDIPWFDFRLGFAVGYRFGR